MNNDNLRKPSAPERTIRLIEYLRKNTDKDHTVKLGNIKNAFQDMGLKLGNDSTINSLVKDIAHAYNSDMEEHALPQSEWRIVFDDYIKNYNNALYDENESDETDDDKKPSMHIKNLYYVPEFTYEEIDALIEAVLFSKTLTTEQAKRIITTLEEQFTSKYYIRGGARAICKVHEKPDYNKELLRENLITIQQAIKDRVQIEYQFNGYSHNKKLTPMGNYKRRVSPYYIVADNGRYYLLAANEEYKNTLILRIDLMTEVNIPNRNETIGNKGIPSIPKKDISGMPQEWNGDFPMKHINMSYDMPVRIKLRVKSEKSEQDKRKHIDPDYTFLHDNFGDNYKYLGVDEENSDYDIVEVESSIFGMVNFALKYADKVEVLEPPEVREKMREKAQMLQKYYLNS